MSHPVAAAALAGAPRERGWGWFVVSLVVALAVSLIGFWTPSLALLGAGIRFLLPIEQFGLLVAGGVAACSVVAWWSGGRFLSALGWCGWFAVLLWRWPLPGGGYGEFVRGWVLVLGATFGLVGLISLGRPFFERSATAVALAAVLVLSATGMRSGGLSEGLQRTVAVFDVQVAARVGASLSVWRERRSDPAWLTVTDRVPAVRGTADRVVASLENRSPPVLLLPALLVLESLVALALAWAIWHRLARVRLGPPLSRTQDFRFGDQLVWGVVVGVTVLLVPGLGAWRGAGVNLLIVFGALYALRGFGVCLSWIPERWAVIPAVLLLLGVSLLGPVRVLVIVLAVTLGLGLGDTWRDLRRAALPRDSAPRP